MTSLTETSNKKRPEFRNIHLLGDLPGYKLPPAGIVSILHRISGLLMFLLLPFVIWMFEYSVTSEYSFVKFVAIFNQGAGFVPGVVFKLLALALIWAYLHHLFAGLRHVWMDISHHSVNKVFGRQSALAVFFISIVLTAALGAKLFGLY